MDVWPNSEIKVFSHIMSYCISFLVNVIPTVPNLLMDIAGYPLHMWGYHFGSELVTCSCGWALWIPLHEVLV